MVTAQQWNLVEDINGIGPALAAHMATIGYRYTQDLLRMDPVHVAADLEQIEGISAAQVTSSFVPQARMLQLTGITPRQANQLVDAGLGSYARLAWFSARRVAQIAAVDGAEPAETVVLRWQSDAARRARAATVTVRVRDGDGNPIAGAEVQAARPYTRELEFSPNVGASDTGNVVFEMVEPGMLELFVWAPGHTPVPKTIPTKPDDRFSIVVTLVPGDDSRLTVDEFGNGVLLFGPPATSDRDVVDRDELAAVEAFQVALIDGGDATLKALQYRQFGLTRWTYGTKVPVAELPSGAGIGSVLIPQGDGWALSEFETGRQWRSAQLEASHA